MSPAAPVTRSAHGRRRAPRRRPPAWLGRTALVGAGMLALASGTGAAALVDGVAAPAADLATSRTDAVEVNDVPGDGAASRSGAVVGAPGESSESSSADPTTPGPSPSPADEPRPEAGPARPVEVPLPDGMTRADAAAGLLSLAMPASAGGELVVVPGTEAAPAPDRRARTVRVEVEAGLDVDGALFARAVMDTLNDPRSWVAEGEISFARTDGDADLRVVLASPQKVDEMCAPLTTRGVYSCGAYGHAALNHMRWVQGTEEFDDLTQYRQYLVNHEVGHLLGRRHEGCPGTGQVAPVMQQQTIRVAPCLPNAWPYPDAS